jgi:hypothetical protein
MVRINIESERFGDGSEVFNVLLGSIRLPAVSQDDAVELADKIQKAIDAHTNEEASVSSQEAVQ